MTVRVVAANGSASGAAVFTEDGRAITDITAVDICIRPGGLVTAKIEVFTRGIDVNAHPLLGLDTLREAAALYGFKLVEIDG